MAITLEDGTGVAGAETYISVADASTFHSDRGNSTWTGTDAVKEQALRRGMAYIEGAYRDRWKGYKRYGYSTNMLAWPRTSVLDTEGNLICGHEEIPLALKHAVAVAALREMVDPGTLAPDDDRGGAIRSIRAGSVGIDYAANAPTVTVRREISHLLSLLVGQPANAITLRRA